MSKLKKSAKSFMAGLSYKYSTLSKKHPKLAKALPIFLVAIVGTAVVLFASAATFSIGIEPETNIASNLVVSDSTASGGKAVQFGGSVVAADCPAISGVTCKEIDGGVNYYSKWQNTLPSDPNFFPLSIFNGFDLANKAAGHKAAGINTYIGLYNGPLSGSPSDISVAKSLGMYAIVGGNYSTDTGFKNSWGSTAAGYVYQDEAEGDTCNKIDVDFLKAICKESGGKILTSSFVEMSNLLRAKDTTRPVYQGFTNGFGCNWYVNGSVQDLADSGDIIGYDVYVKIIDYDYGTCFDHERDWGHYQTVSATRGYAGYKKPIMPVIEMTAMDPSLNSSGNAPTTADIKAMPWQAIIGGARGITWFNNDFTSNGGSQDILNDSRYTSVRAAVTSVNQQITRLAPVINSPFVNGFYTNTGSITSMAKYSKGENAIYVFAGAKSTSSQNVSFTIKSGASVTVVDESRTIPISNGVFSDAFSGEAAYHIYKVAL